MAEPAPGVVIVTVSGAQVVKLDEGLLTVVVLVGGARIEVEEGL